MAVDLFRRAIARAQGFAAAHRELWTGTDLANDYKLPLYIAQAQLDVARQEDAH